MPFIIQYKVGDEEFFHKSKSSPKPGKQFTLTQGRIEDGKQLSNKLAQAWGYLEDAFVSEEVEPKKADPKEEQTAEPETEKKEEKKARVRLTTAMEAIDELDRIASEVESENPVVAMAIDKISDGLQDRVGAGQMRVHKISIQNQNVKAFLFSPKALIQKQISVEVDQTGARQVTLPQVILSVLDQLGVANTDVAQRWWEYDTKKFGKLYTDGRLTKNAITFTSDKVVNVSESKEEMTEHRFEKKRTAPAEMPAERVAAMVDELDRLAAEIEAENPVVAMYLDKISDAIEARDVSAGKKSA